MGDSERRAIAVCQELTENIHNLLRTNPQEWHSCLPEARAIMVLIDGLPSPLETLGSDLYLDAISTIQNLIYQEADTGAEKDIALWCERNWTILLERRPDNYEALQGGLQKPMSNHTAKSLTKPRSEYRPWPCVAAEKSRNAS